MLINALCSVSFHLHWSYMTNGRRCSSACVTVFKLKALYYATKESERNQLCLSVTKLKRYF